MFVCFCCCCFVVLFLGRGVIVLLSFYDILYTFEYGLHGLEHTDKNNIRAFIYIYIYTGVGSGGGQGGHVPPPTFLTGGQWYVCAPPPPHF